jgi:hypothetical protein
MATIDRNLDGIPDEDKTKWEFALVPGIIKIRGEHVPCPRGYHYKKGYPTKYGYVRGFCVKNPRKNFRIVD